MSKITCLLLLVLTFSFAAKADQLPVIVSLPPMWDCLDGSWALSVEDCTEKVQVKDRAEFSKQILARGQKVPPKNALIKNSEKLERVQVRKNP